MEMSVFFAVLTVVLAISTEYAVQGSVTFSLPSVAINIVEGNVSEVCVTKAGQTEQLFAVNIFTNELELGAVGFEDFQPFNATLFFAPEVSVQCVNLFAFRDNIVEEPNIFEVVIKLNAQNATINTSRVNVVITDANIECSVGDFTCFPEAFCLPQAYVCDGIEDCLFPVDEVMCENRNPCESEGEFRLRGGQTQAEGLVEVCYEGSFRTIHLFSTRIFDAALVCRTLGFIGGGVWVNAWREYMTIGNGSVLSSCIFNDTHGLVGCTVDAERVHVEDAGIRCLDTPECEDGNMQLVGGSTEVEGAVQLCIGGVWGSVVSFTWEFSEARVVCRNLGRSENGALPIPRFFFGDSAIFANFASCDGAEESLFDCELSHLSGETSETGYVVGVRCADLPGSECSNGDVRLITRDSEATGRVEVCSGNRWGAVCFSEWDINEAMVVCRQLGRTVVNSASVISFPAEEGDSISPLQFLDCNGNEQNLLQCPSLAQRKRRQLEQICFSGLEAGVMCAESPQLLLSPPPEDGNYDVEVGRITNISCFLQPNLFYPSPTNLTIYQVSGNEMLLMDTTIGNQISLELDGRIEDAGVYVCRAENEIGSTSQTITVNIIVPSGALSRTYIRFSLPRFEDRIVLLLDTGDIGFFLRIIEEFLVFGALNPVTSPGQQVVNCNTVERSMTDLERKRDRYECVLDNYPPLQDDPTALAEIVVRYIEGQFISTTAFNISVIGFCDSEPSAYFVRWPETEANDVASIPCDEDDGVATRVCSPDNGGQWMEPDISQCGGPTINPTTEPPTDPELFCCRDDDLCITQDRVCDGIVHCNFLDDEVFCPPVVTGCNDGDVRLSPEIGSNNEGIVEYCVDGAWGSLCESTFSVANARVVCRELGLPDGAVFLNDQQSLLPAHPISLSCSGFENSLSQCERTQLNDISFSCDRFLTRAAVRCQAPVDCEDGELRLFGGNDEREGSLQICFNGVWGSVCLNGDNRAARVACNQLGYNPSGALLLPFGFFREDRRAPPLLSGIICFGDEFRLLDCSAEGQEGFGNRFPPANIRCDSYPTEGCVSGSVRLTNRSGQRDGIAEICIDGQWGTLCFDGPFTSSEVQVVCRQLGFSSEGFNVFPARINEGLVHNATFQCEGSESSLFDCNIGPELSFCFNNIRIQCSGAPDLYLSPPPTAGDTYVVEVGHPLEVNCSVASEFSETGTIGFRIGNEINEICTEKRDSFFQILDVEFGAQLSAAGDYRCISCNSFDTAVIDFSVVVLGPPVGEEGSSAVLRVSIPTISRLAAIVELESQVLREVLLSALQAELASLEVIENEDGIQTIMCLNVSRIPVDIDARRDRYECTITTYSQTRTGVELVDRMANELHRGNVQIFSDISTSAIGFCESEPSAYFVRWPETGANDMASIPCDEDDGVATRVCSPDNGGQWMEPDISQCGGPTDNRYCCENESVCITQDRLCDGIAHCNLIDDEAFCRPVVTGCINGDVRLSLGISDNEGIVEYCVNGAWGSLCESIFSVANARVVCRQLGLPNGAVRLRDVQSLSQVHPISLSCSGSETGLSQCERSQLNDISSSCDRFTRATVRCQAPVNCEDGDLRLFGGSGEREGSLQICFNGVWGSVCLNGDNRAARVACNQLGYNPAGALVLPSGFFREDTSFPLLLSDPICFGDEALLVECRNDGEESGCSPFNIRCDAYPNRDCDPDDSVRLINRNSLRDGTLEICQDGQWGALCYDEVNKFNQAGVACRDLGFSPEGSIVSPVGLIEGLVHNDTFVCGGNEESILQCSSGPQLPFCSEAVSIQCSGAPDLYLSPPPTDGDTYVVEVGHPLVVTCSVGNEFFETGTIGFRIENETNCREERDSDFDVIAHGFGTPLSAAGRYRCISCNIFDTAVIDFRVQVRGPPEGEGSSAILRLSIPTTERLSVIVRVDEVVLEEVLLDALQSIIAGTEVIEEEEGVQTIECHNVSRTPVDIDARRDRYECNITTYSPASNAVELVERVANEISREDIQIYSALITSEGGFCSYDEVGLYMWPETRGGISVSLPCQLDSTIEVTRDCLNGGVWDEPADAVCSLLEETNEDNLDENNMNAVSVVQQEEQTANNARLVRDVIVSTAMFVVNNISLVDEELVDNVVEVLDGLQQWPADAVQADDNGAEIVESFEILAISLALQENFTELTIMNENIAVSIQSVDRDDITTGMSISVSEGEGSLNATIGNDSTLAPDEIASGFLPFSLFEMFGPDEESIPIVFAVLRSGSLFSIEGNQGDVEGLETSVGSPVVSLTAGVNRTFINLPDPVIVNVRILVPNFTNPRCVSYDFDQQVWVTDGCTTIQSSDKSLITCECDHLTNFASLVDICSRTEEGGCGQSADARLALDVISIIGVILSGLGLILTILTLLLFNKLRKRDASKFHIQLSLALLGMLIVFAVGVDRTDVFEGCVTVSVLIHYFTLVAVMWMGAEAVLMFQKLVVVFVQITTRYIIIVSLVCWLAPIIPAVTPAIIDPDLMVTDTDTNEFCFIGDVRVFFAAFLGPIFAILLFNLVIFIIVIVVLIRHTRNKLGKTTDARKQRKSNIRLAMSLFGIMILFGLTWVLGAFTISEASLTFQILFVIFNSLQGFFIFIFFCVLSKDVRQLWLEKVTCGRYVKSKSSYTSGGKKDLSTGQLHSGVKQKSLASTTSTGLSSLPSSKYAADSSIELSEYPSSTVIDNEFSISTMEKEQPSRGPLPQFVSQPPTSSHAHFFKNPAVEGEAQTTRGASKLGAFESMRVTVEFKDNR